MDKSKYEAALKMISRTITYRDSSLERLCKTINNCINQKSKISDYLCSVKKEAEDANVLNYMATEAVILTGLLFDKSPEDVSKDVEEIMRSRYGQD